MDALLWLMVIAGVALLVFGTVATRKGKVQIEIAPLIPEMMAQGGDATAVTQFQSRSEAIFTRHQITDAARKRELIGYALIIAKSKLSSDAYAKARALLLGI